MDPLSPLRICPADPSAPEVAALIEAHESAARLHYDVEDCHALDGDALADHDVTLYAAWRGGQVLAIGGLKNLDDGTAELKSVFAAEAARGQGVARAILDHLLTEAKARGRAAVVLEAGRSDAYAAPARALYARAGFNECPPFGEYTAREASIFMRRDL